MKIFKSTSLENYIARQFIFFSIFFLLFIVFIKKVNFDFWNTVFFIGIFFIVIFFFMQGLKKCIFLSFERALLHIEALQQEDYNLTSKSLFESGIIKRFHLELAKISQNLAANKSRYAQHAFLIYQLIDQLNTPVLVFNQTHKLSYANGAFSLLYQQPWQMYRYASPKLLNLIEQNNKWSFKGKNSPWQISQSCFIDEGETYHLLIFINIESAINEIQLKAWQQIISVIGHEVNNSLTPVSSLAESLVSHVDSSRDKQALELISERCHHLQEFINRYSSLSKKLIFSFTKINISILLERLKVLFQNINLEINTAVVSIWADEIFFEQVLINLIKNSIEANASHISINIYEIKNNIKLEIIDNGHGFANLDNLFVPLFSTKVNGQGIGLSFCRNIIMQHQGNIDLKNNLEKGVKVTITLPLH